MKRFDIAIKVLWDEIHRVTGKVAIELLEKGHDPEYSIRSLKTKNLKKAIDILQGHSTNKNI